MIAGKGDVLLSVGASLPSPVVIVVVAFVFLVVVFVSTVSRTRETCLCVHRKLYVL